MPETLIYACPACGAPVKETVKANTQQVCTYCGSTFSFQINAGEDGLPAGQPSTEEIQEAIRLARSEQLSLAVMKYSQLFRVDLEKAIEDVEKLAEGETVIIAGLRLAPEGDVTVIEPPLPALEEPHWVPEDIPALAGMVQGGQKIEAIKKLRQMFPLGLSEARQAVEALEQGEAITIGNIQIAPSGEYISTTELPPTVANLAGKPEELAEMARRLQAGDEPGAIRLYRTIYDTNLQDARRAVRKLMGRPEAVPEIDPGVAWLESPAAMQRAPVQQKTFSSRLIVIGAVTALIALCGFGLALAMLLLM